MHDGYHLKWPIKVGVWSHRLGVARATHSHTLATPLQIIVHYYTQLQAVTRHTSTLPVLFAVATVIVTYTYIDSRLKVCYVHTQYTLVIIIL